HSAGVRSGWARASSASRSRWPARSGTGPERRRTRGASSPPSRRRCLIRRTHASLTAKVSAASAVPIPSSQAANTRCRKSTEYARIAALLVGRVVYEPSDKPLHLLEWRSKDHLLLRPEGDAGHPRLPPRGGGARR